MRQSQYSSDSKTSYTQLRLEPLPPASAEAFLAGLLGDHLSMSPLLPLLLARTAGNPFFLEESVRTLVETAALVGSPGVYRLATPLQGLPIPATVHAVLTARIDRLPPEEKRRFCQVVEAETLIRQAGASPRSYPPFRRPVPYL